MMTGMTDTALPERLAEIRDEFLELPEADRLQLLLEYSYELPAVPAEYEGHP
jgi:cysteine desulfuration protein SufE